MVTEKETEEDELVKRIKNIEKRLGEIERESKSGLEDQLFFGVIVSLAIFVITLPLTDLASFFQTVFKMETMVASNLSETVRDTTVAFLLLSILLRYYGAIKPHKGARLWSFLCLMISLNCFLFAFLPRLTLNIAVEVRAIVFPFSLLALFVIYVLLGEYVEKKIISFYAERGLVLKRYVKPVVSFLFALVTICVYMTFLIQLIAIAFFNINFNEVEVSVVYFLTVFLGAVGYLSFLRRAKIIGFKIRRQ